jgi:hypothetical protein
MGATVFFADSAEFATLQNIFQVSGVSTDPTTVSCTVTDPTGASTVHTYNGASPADIARTATGTYQLLVACTLTGLWGYLWEGTGTASDAQAGTWTVTRSSLNQNYCSIEELKSRLGIALTDTPDNFELLLAVDAASGAIDEVTGRYFWRGQDTRTYVPQSIYRQDIDDLAVTTGLAVSVDRNGDGVYEEAWTLNTDYQLEVSPGRYNPAAKGEQWPYTGFSIIGPKYIPIVWPWSFQNRIQVSGVFGWPAVPRNVKQATLISAADFFRLKDAPFGIAGFGEFAIRIQQNPRVMQLLKRYISGRSVGV